MGWKKLKDGVSPGWYEDLTHTAGGTVDVDSSAIDFLPSGTTFTVMYNTEAVATNSQTADVDILAASATDGTYSVVKADLIANGAGSVMTADDYIPGTTGAGSNVYKVRIDPDGDLDGAKVRVAIVASVGTGGMSKADGSGMPQSDIGGLGADPS
jgi:hypothetical protein